MKLIKKNNKMNNKKNKKITSINEDQFGSDSDINECEKFDNINEIEDFDDSGNENHNIYHKKKEGIKILKTKVKQKIVIMKKIL